MATWIADRSTYWVNSGTNTPYSDGDYRFYWKIYYEQTDNDRDNNRSSVIVETYLQTHFTDDSLQSAARYPGGSVSNSVNGSWFDWVSIFTGVIPIGSNYKLEYYQTNRTTVKHNNDGTGSFTWQGSGFGKYTAVSTYSLPTIPRNSILNSVPDFDVDDGFTVDITKYVSSFYNRLRIYTASTLIKIVYDIEDGDTVHFTENELNQIYSKIPTGDYGTFMFELTTFDSSSYDTEVGSTSNRNARGNLKIVLPSFGGFTYEDSNSETAQLTTGNDTSDVIVKGHSTLKVTIPYEQRGIANTRQATMQHYLIDGKSEPYQNDIVTKELENYTKDNVSVYAVDSRGDTSLVSNTSFVALGKFIDYFDVTKKDDNTYERSDNGVGSQLTISFSGTWWNNTFGNVNNTLQATYKYRKSDRYEEYVDGETEIVLVIDDNKYSYTGIIQGDQEDGGFDISESYDIIVTVEDELSKVEINYTIHAGEPAIAIYKNKVAFGAAYDETLGGIQVYGDLYLNKEEVKSNSREIIYSGHLEGGQRLILSNTKRYLDIYATIHFREWNAIIKYTLDTTADAPTYGSGVIISFDLDTGEEYYVSECSYDNTSNTLTHVRMGFINVLTGAFSLRNDNSGYYIYQIETHD